MCGRFVSATPPDQIASYFGTEPAEAVLPARYNVAPTDDVYAVLVDGGARRLDAFHWGLVPRWAEDPKVGSRMINARAETLATKPAYKPAFARRRCLIPATGFYEWRKLPGTKVKQPYLVRHPDGAPYALAGLWEQWGSGEGSEQLRSCTIITTTPNPAMARVHDRMPVILPPEAWDLWLDPDERDLDRLGRLLVPADARLTVLQPVSTEVNDVRHDGPHLLEPVSEPVQSGT